MMGRYFSRNFDVHLLRASIIKAKNNFNCVMQICLLGCGFTNSASDVLLLPQVDVWALGVSAIEMAEV